MFVITGARYTGVLFHTLYYYWAEEYRSLYRGLRYLGIFLHRDSTVPNFSLKRLRTTPFEAAHTTCPTDVRDITLNFTSCVCHSDTCPFSATDSEEMCVLRRRSHLLYDELERQRQGNKALKREVIRYK